LPEDIVQLIDEAEALTERNRGLTLVIALNYGSQLEIVRAAQALACEVARGSLLPEDIDETAFRKRLQTADIPDPDVLIRTSGEQRLSNFLLWQAAYAELVFLDILWPDFGKADLAGAIDEFHRRERRYGAVSS